MKNKSSIYDYFKLNASEKRYFFEIETGIKKNQIEVLQSIEKIRKTKNFNKKKILCILPNSIRYIEYFLAIISTGGTFVPIPYFTEKNEIKKIINYIQPDYIVSDKTRYFKNYSNYINVNKKLDKKRFTIPKKNKVNDLAAIYYSSGTTGNPKGIMYSNQNMISLIESINKDFGFNKTDRHLALLPFGHTASINYNILPALMVGSELYISRGFENMNISFFKLLKKFNITYTQVVPSILFILNKMNIKISKNFLPKLKFLGCGSSYLPLSKQKEFIKKYKIKVANLYGLSETGPTHIDDPRLKNWKPGSIGKPLSVCKFKLDKNGNILIKGKNLFTGYYKNKKQYKTVVKNGWFNTGDIGLKKGKEIIFLDRSKDLIIKNGINIIPGEVEEAIYKSKKILECCVVGIKDEFQGEEIAAAINPIKKDIDFEKLIGEIKISCKRYLSNYKLPKFFFYLSKFPKTASGKIKRKEIRTLLGKKFK